jgi:hypothetical protein
LPPPSTNLILSSTFIDVTTFAPLLVYSLCLVYWRDKGRPDDFWTTLRNFGHSDALSALYIIMMPGNIDTIIEMQMLAVPTLKKNKTEKGFF